MGNLDGCDLHTHTACVSLEPSNENGKEGFSDGPNWIWSSVSSMRGPDRSKLMNQASPASQ